MRWLLRLATPLAALMLVHCGGSSTPDNANPPLPPPLPTYLAFQESGAMSTNRSAFCATLLADGKVLITEGDQGSAGQGTECFDPTLGNGTGGFTTQGTMSKTRYFHAASLLPNGQVLISGGSSSDPIASMDLYTPGTSNSAGSVAPASPMLTARSTHSQTTLPNGQVLLAGGAGSSAATPQTTEWFNPSAAPGSPLSPGPQMIHPRSGHLTVLLKNQALLVLGGGKPIAEILK